MINPNDFSAIPKPFDKFCDANESFTNSVEAQTRENRGINDKIFMIFIILILMNL